MILNKNINKINKYSNSYRDILPYEYYDPSNELSENSKLMNKMSNIQRSMFLAHTNRDLIIKKFKRIFEIFNKLENLIDSIMLKDDLLINDFRIISLYHKMIQHNIKSLHIDKSINKITEELFNKKLTYNTNTEEQKIFLDFIRLYIGFDSYYNVIKDKYPFIK